MVPLSLLTDCCLRAPAWSDGLYFILQVMSHAIAMKVLAQTHQLPLSRFFWGVRGGAGGQAGFASHNISYKLIMFSIYTYLYIASFYLPEAINPVLKCFSRIISHCPKQIYFILHFHALEKEMGTHSSVLAWRVPGTGEPGGLPSMGSHRVGHDCSDLAAAAAAGCHHQYHHGCCCCNTVAP